MIKWLGMSCGGPCKGTKSQQSKLSSLSICTIMLCQVSEQVTKTQMTF
jgi:hypothetical protein